MYTEAYLERRTSNAVQAFLLACALLFVTALLLIGAWRNPFGSPNSFAIVMGPLLALMALLMWSETEWNASIEGDHFIPWKRSYVELLRGKPPLPYPLKGATIEEVQFRDYPDEPALSRLSVRIRFGDGRSRWVMSPWSLRPGQLQNLLARPEFAAQIGRFPALAEGLEALAEGERRRLENLAQRRIRE